MSHHRPKKGKKKTHLFENLEWSKNDRGKSGFGPLFDLLVNPLVNPAYPTPTRAQHTTPCQWVVVQGLLVVWK